MSKKKARERESKKARKRVALAASSSHVGFVFCQTPLAFFRYRRRLRCTRVYARGARGRWRRARTQRLGRRAAKCRKKEREGVFFVVVDDGEKITSSSPTSSTVLLGPDGAFDGYREQEGSERARYKPTRIRANANEGPDGEGNAREGRREREICPGKRRVRETSSLRRATTAPTRSRRTEIDERRPFFSLLVGVVSCFSSPL
jgi:hypothetical protein